MGTLGEWIKDERERQGMTQTALAVASGTSRSYMSQIESGRVAFPNADLRRRIATALGVSHLRLMIAAGELTEEEVTSLGVQGVEPIDPRRQELCDLLSHHPRPITEGLVASVRSILDLHAEPRDPTRQ